MKICNSIMLLVACILTITVSCTSTCKMGVKKQLTSNAWELSSLNGKIPDMAEFRTGMPFILFDKSGRMSGSTGCNNFMGKYEISKTGFKPDAGAMTRMACQGKGEAMFIEALNQAKNIRLDSGKLVLLDGTNELMTLLPKK